MRYFIYFFAAFLSLSLVSCNDEELGTTEENASDNPVVLRAMSELMEQYDTSGNLEAYENPTGCMVLDFCFEFIYPISFELSDGSIVTVENPESLIDILITSTENLYVNDIVYPFEVETYNNETNSFEVIIIENNESFESLLNSCTFEDDYYACTEEFNPVCVSINTDNGEMITIAYPNACWAELDGFSEEDFLEDCDYEGSFYGEDDYYYGDDYYGYGMGCGDLVFPVSLQISNDEIVTLNSLEEFVEFLDNLPFNNPEFDGVIDFVYPIQLTFETSEEGQVTVDVESEEHLYQVIEQNCGDDWSGEFPNDCNSCTDEENLVCVEFINPADPNDVITEVFLNPCHAICAGFTEADFVDCQ